MLKRCFFQLHFLIGISFGLVLAMMGLTGVVYCFEEELIQVIDSSITKVKPEGRRLLTPSDLLVRVKSKNPNVSSLSLSNDPHEAARVGFMNPVNDNKTKKFELLYLDPYTGELLGKPASEEFFRTVLNLHRTLSLDNIGKSITGASTLMLVVLIFSGVYLRWRQIKQLNWRTWLLINTQEKGRSFLANLHAISGAYLFSVYLLFALTGLAWSYDWYRGGLVGVVGATKSTTSKATLNPVAAMDKSSHFSGFKLEKNPEIDLDMALVWKTFNAKVPHYQKLVMLLPSTPMQSVQILYLDPSATHPYANNRIVIDGISGAVEKHELYADKTTGEKIMASLYAIHSGHFFGLTGRLIMALASLLLPFFFVTGCLMYLQRRKAKSN